MQISRRALLQALATAGCSAGTAASPTNDGESIDTVCLSPGASAAASSQRIPFLDEGQVPFDAPLDAGLDGRLYTNLSRLTTDTTDLIVPNDRFYIRTRKPGRLTYDAAMPWRIRVNDAVDIPIEDLLRDARDQGATLLECSGNAMGGSYGLMSAARWSGVPLIDAIAAIPASPEKQRVLVSGFDDHSLPSTRSTPGASWIFTRDELAKAGAFLAVTMNGIALPDDHGRPVRLVVPNWYGCTCIKWVNEIRFVGEDEPSTPHMREFASRTHQDGEPVLARDFKSAAIDLAAMPIAIHGSTERLRFTGIHWGGDRIAADLDLHVTTHLPKRVSYCVSRASTKTWGLWVCEIEMLRKGTYEVWVEPSERSLLHPSKRLDSRFYKRSFTI